MQLFLAAFNPQIEILTADFVACNLKSCWMLLFSMTVCLLQTTPRKLSVVF